MIANKKEYIMNRYVKKRGYKKSKVYHGFDLQKGARVTRPFSSFYPDPVKLSKK